MSIKIIFITLCVSALFLALYSTNFAEEAAGPQYVGNAKCQMCHSNDKIAGTEYTIWKESAHAKAYDTLATDAAKAAAKEAGIEGDPQKADACLKCHVTAWEEKKELKADSLKKEDGVGCETCHGPGADYMAMPVMKDHAKALEAGLLVPNKETCLGCHNEESPFYKEFKYEERLKEIKHWE